MRTSEVFDNHCKHQPTVSNSSRNSLDLLSRIISSLPDCAERKDSAKPGPAKLRRRLYSHSNRLFYLGDPCTSLEHATTSVAVNTDSHATFPSLDDLSRVQLTHHSNRPRRRTMSEHESRRQFLKQTAAFGAIAAAGCHNGKHEESNHKSMHPATRPSTMPTAMNKLNVAGIGVMGKGESDLGGISKSKDVNIVALCDTDETSLAKAKSKYPGAKTYYDFRKMLEEQKDIDAVTVSTPDHMHAPAAMMAIKMGKHVYVQKPLTHTVEEARKLTMAAREYKVASAMGNQGHSGEGWRVLCEYIWNGAIGDVTEVHCWTNRPIWPQGMGKP